MRNHSDNTYNPLLDGNLNLTLHRIYNPLRYNTKLTVTITIPTNCNNDQKEILIDFCNKTYGENRVIFEEIEYGLNAEENRTALKTYTMPYPSIYDVIISDFSGVESLSPHKNVIYNFNISKNATLDRWYVDNHFEDQYNTLVNNVDNGIYGLTYVLNDNQKEYMLNYNESNKIIVNAGVIVDSKIINASLLNAQQFYFYELLSLSDKQQIDQRILTILDNNDLVLFMPFRLSDECYNFKGLVDYLKDRKEKITIIITNPNDAKYDVPENIEIVNITEGYTNKKSVYFFLLTLIDKYNIHIPIFEDPSVVLHQTILEMYMLTDKCVFLNKNNFNYETLSTIDNKNEYLDKLYYEEPRRLY
jgi:hypothetical protein